ncbi:MAG: S1 family peptidase [Armatimonadota bacterium]
MKRIIILLAASCVVLSTPLFASPKAVKEAYMSASKAMVTLMVDTTVSGAGQKETVKHLESWAVVVNPGSYVIAPLLDADPVFALSLVRTAMSAAGQKPSEVSLTPAKLKIRLDDGKEIDAEIVKRDEAEGLALLRLTNPPDNLQPMTIGKVRDARMGDEIVVLQPMGSGYGSDVAVTPLTINMAIHKPNYYTVLFNQLQSGCPVFSRDDGTLLGVVVPLVSTNLNSSMVTSGLLTVASGVSLKKLAGLPTDSVEPSASVREKMADKINPALVSLSWVLKQTGPNGQPAESKRVGQALLLSPEGLMVCDGAGMGVFADPAKVQIIDLKAVLNDGTSIPVSIARKDSDWRLAWLKPTSAPANPLPFINQPAAGSLKLSEDLWSVFRAPEGMQYAVGVQKMCYIGSIDNPVVMPLGMGDGELNSPVFTSDGKWVGLVVNPPGESEFGVDEITILPVKNLMKASGLPYVEAK